MRTAGPDQFTWTQVWNNLTLELQPDGKGGASVVWQWSLWDHLAQDYDAEKENYVEDIATHPQLFDINYCPPGKTIVILSSHVLY